MLGEGMQIDACVHVWSIERDHVSGVKWSIPSTFSSDTVLPLVLSQVPVLSSGNSTTLPKGSGIFCMVLPHI